MFIGELYEHLVDNFGHRYTDLEIQAMMFECLGHMVCELAPQASAHFFTRADEVSAKIKSEERRK